MLQFPYTSEKFDRNTIVRDAKHFTATHGEANGDQEEDQSQGVDRHARENAADGNSEEVILAVRLLLSSL